MKIKKTALNRVIFLIVLALVLILSNANSSMADDNTPVISVSQANLPPGSVVTVTGSYFGADETGITITLDGSPVATGITAGYLGDWSGTFIVPDIAFGNHAIHAYGSMTPASAVPGITLKVSVATLIASQTKGPGGTLVTVSGWGFATNEAGITITFDGNPVTRGIKANSVGTWSGNFIVPASTSGTHSISAYGSITSSSYVPSLSFTVVNATVTINPASGLVGTLATVTGSGFGAGETGITLTYDGQPVIANIKADSLGNWSGNFTVPDSAPGSHNISAYGSITLSGSVSSPGFKVNPGITISPTGGVAGTSVNVTGSGFRANDSPILITYDGAPVALSAANAMGIWRGNFIVPASPSGSHIISALWFEYTHHCSNPH